jgi:hypothetical protein
MSDRASKALVEASLPGESRTYDARSKRSRVPLTTLYYRDHGRPSREEKALEIREGPGLTVSHSIGGESPRKVFETNG